MPFRGDAIIVAIIRFSPKLKEFRANGNEIISDEVIEALAL
jgi:hypothetical protein